MKHDFSKISDKEQAQAFIFPHGLSAEEKAEADEEVKVFRQLRLQQMTEKERVLSDLLRLKFQMEDYIKQVDYSDDCDFHVFLQKYLKILDKKQNVFAKEIGLHSTKVSQILTGKASPNIALSYRLEVHSGGLISAVLWWRLLAKKIAFDIKQDNSAKLEEAKNVLFSFNYA